MAYRRAANRQGPRCRTRLSFDVAYQPGTIEAVGYTGGRETGRTRLVTAASPAALRAHA